MNVDAELRKISPFPSNQVRTVLTFGWGQMVIMNLGDLGSTNTSVNNPTTDDRQQSDGCGS